MPAFEEFNRDVFWALPEEVLQQVVLNTDQQIADESVGDRLPCVGQKRLKWKDIPIYLKSFRRKLEIR